MDNVNHPLYRAYRVSLRILEDWGMMLVDKSENSDEFFNLIEPLYMSHVDVNGPFEGSISIIAQREFIQRLAANLLGVEPQDDEDDIEEGKDAFMEMGNVLAGNLLTELYGNDVAFDILNPRVMEISLPEYEKVAKSPRTQFFRADDTSVCVTFSVNR